MYTLPLLLSAVRTMLPASSTIPTSKWSCLYSPRSYPYHCYRFDHLQLLGKSNHLKDFIQRGKDTATLEIELCSSRERTSTLRREVHLNSSKWFIDGVFFMPVASHTPVPASIGPAVHTHCYGNSHYQHCHPYKNSNSVYTQPMATCWLGELTSIRPLAEPLTSSGPEYSERFGNVWDVSGLRNSIEGPPTSPQFPCQNHGPNIMCHVCHSFLSVPSICAIASLPHPGTVLSQL